MPVKNLPPLEVDTAYLAADFERFEYAHAVLTGSETILRLHLKNGTSIDLPATDSQLWDLLVMLAEAFPQATIQHVRKRWGASS